MNVTASLFQHLFDEVSDITLIARAVDWQVVACNASACAHLEMDAPGVLRRSLLDLPLTEDERRLLRQESMRLLAMDETGSRTGLELRLGKPIPLAASLSRVADENGEPLLMLVAPANRIPAAKHVPADGLTGLPSRAALDATLSRLRATATGGARHALFFLDVDQFKTINDTYGHLSGDAVLRGVAQRLVRCLRPGDLTVRFGGDEFVALVAGIALPVETDQIASRIQRAMRSPFHLPHAKLRVSVSVGVAVSSSDCQIDGQTLLQRADEAMYQAKSLGPDGPYVKLSAG